MAANIHITKEDFFKLLEKRLGEYRVAILGRETSSSLVMSMLQIKSRSIQRMQELDSNSNLFGNGFWGYGINAVCDGNESHSHFDVEEIKKIGELNKHQREYRKCLLLTFKVENSFLYVSLFSIDTCVIAFNSTVHTKYDLKKFNNARQKIREGKIFVEFIFNEIGRAHV